MFFKKITPAPPFLVATKEQPLKMHDSKAVELVSLREGFKDPSHGPLRIEKRKIFAENGDL